MTKKYNILYVLTDQHRFDMIGAYGNQQVSTPNIDQLAREGVRFDHAFTPSSICGPARTSLFTGRVPSGHGVIGNAEYAGNQQPLDPNPDLPVLTNYLDDYEKIYIGKWHVAETKLPRDYGFRGHNFSGYGFPGSELYENMVFSQPPEENRYREWLEEKGFPIPSVSESFCGDNPNMQCQELRGKLSGPAEASIPHFLVDDAKSELADVKEDGKPFFMWLNFWGPHTPCVIPEPYYSMYDPESIPEDPAFQEKFENKPIHHQRIAKMWGVYDLSWREWSKIVARYYGYITMMDDCLGDLFSFLKERNLYDDTIIVFTSDHGDAMGAHKLIEKGAFMYDVTYKIPFIARHPDVKKQGTVCDEFIYLHDLLPTLADITTANIPKLPQAKSILPLMKGESAQNQREYVFAQFTRHFTAFNQRMLRTKTHKLIFNAACIGELYDLESDPNEMVNVINHPDYRSIKKDLLMKMKREMEMLEDPLLVYFNRVCEFY